MSQRLSKACMSFRCLASQAFSFSSQLVAAFFWLYSRGPAVILRALTCLDKGSETAGFSRVLGVLGIISIFLYQGDGDQLMKGPTAAVVIFYLLMHVRETSAVVSDTYTSVWHTHAHACARTHTHTHTHTRTHTHTYTHARACTYAHKHTHTHTHLHRSQWGDRW